VTYGSPSVHQCINSLLLRSGFRLLGCSHVAFAFACCVTSVQKNGVYRTQSAGGGPSRPAEGCSWPVRNPYAAAVCVMWLVHSCKVRLKVRCWPGLVSAFGRNQLFQILLQQLLHTSLQEAARRASSWASSASRTPLMSFMARIALRTINVSPSSMGSLPTDAVDSHRFGVLTNTTETPRASFRWCERCASATEVWLAGAGCPNFGIALL
jgi:hypothetical protein